MTLDRYKNSFDIVLKLTERCNLACRYCYYFSHEYDASKQPPLIKPEVIRELPLFINRSLRDLRIDIVNLALHGGEPTLMPKAKFDEMCTIIRAEVDPAVELNISIQTNGVLIDTEWVQIFRKHRITVGLSIDGNEIVHDAQRIDRKGRGSYKKTVQGYQTLQKASETGDALGVAAIAVWNGEVGSESLLTHLIDQLGIRQLSLNLPRGGRDNTYVKEWNGRRDQHRTMIRHYLEFYVHPKFHYVGGLSEYFLALLSDPGAANSDRQHSTQHHIATISSSGDLLIDDNVLSIDSSLVNDRLTMFGHSILTLLESETWQRLNAALDERPNACEGCPWYRICRGGKLYNRFSAEDGLKSRSSVCETLQIIYEEFADFLLRKGIVSKSDLDRRLNQAVTFSASDAFQSLRRGIP